MIVSPEMTKQAGSRLLGCVTFRRRGYWLGPAAAAVAGLFTSLKLGWSSTDIVNGLLLVLLAECGWGSTWWALAEVNWSPLLETWHRRSLKQQSTSRGLAGFRSAWSSLVDWFRSELYPRWMPQLFIAVIAILISLALPAIMGISAAAISLGVLALCQLAMFVFPWDTVEPKSITLLAKGAVEMGTPWIAAFLVTRDELSLGAMVAGLGLTLAYSGWIGALSNRQSLVMHLIGYSLVVITLLAQGSIVQGAIVGVMAFFLLGLRSLAGISRSNSTAAQWPLLVTLVIVAASI